MWPWLTLFTEAPKCPKPQRWGYEIKSSKRLRFAVDWKYGNFVFFASVTLWKRVQYYAAGY